VAFVRNRLLRGLYDVFHDVLRGHRIIQKKDLARTDLFRQFARVRAHVGLDDPVVIVMYYQSSGRRQSCGRVGPDCDQKSWRKPSPISKIPIAMRY
jgi:hypothetical protein